MKQVLGQKSWEKLRLIIALFLALTISGFTFRASGNSSVENADLNFLHLNVKNNLSNNTIQCFHQDKVGKMWIGTHDGLNYYDGYEISTFYNGFKDSLSIPNNHIVSLREDFYDNLWIGTASGLCRYIPEKNEFKRYPQFRDYWIIDIYNSSENDLFVVTSEGLYTYDPEYDQFSENLFIDKALNSKKISSILFEVEPGTYFITLGQQPAIFMPEKREITELPTQKKIIANPQNLRFTSFVEIADKHFFLGNISEGLFELKKKKEVWEITEIHSELFQNNGVRDLMKDNEGNIWIASYQGLYILSTDGSFKYITPNNQNPKSISYQSTTTLLQANDKSIWVGTYFGGVNIFRKQNNQFKSIIPKMVFPELKHNSIRAITIDGNENIWFGTQGSGIVIHNPKQNTFKKFWKEELQNTNIHSLLFDPYNRLWIGTYLRGLFVYDISTDKLRHLPDLWTETQVDISCLLLDHLNNLWITTSTHGIKTLKLTADGYSKVRLVQNESSISKSIQHAIKLDNNDIILASFNRIQQYSHQTKIINYLSLENKSIPQKLEIQYVFQDSERNLWLGTKGNGLIKRKNDGLVQVFTTKNGLPNNTVYGILEDDNGNLWISTNMGISRLSKDLSEIKSFTINQGLISNQFCLNSSYKSNNNQFCFGAIGGLAIFNPQHIQSDSTLISPLIDEMRVHNKDIESVDDIKKIEYQNNQLKAVHLKYDHRSFTIKYLAFYYGAQQSIKYRYRLRNFTENWRETNLRTADYTNIDPGSYTFEVEVQNPNGNWSKAANVDIRISPVWYLSNLAFLIYFILVSLLVFLSIKLMRYRINLQNEVRLSKLEVEKTEEVNQIKLRFFTNVSHEFRTPLTLINGPLENLINSEKNADKKLMLEIANRNSNRLLRLVNNILDFRKAEQGNLKLNYTSNDFRTFITNQTEVFKDLAQKKNIKISLQVEETIDSFQFDSEKMETVMFNLLSNAFKFTKENGHIKVGAKTTEKGIEVKVADDGIGIQESILPKIFDRFYQASEIPHSDIKGSGIGLALVKEIVEAHRGKIFVESKENKGTCFSFFIPGDHKKTSDKANAPVTTKKEIALSDANAVPEISGTKDGPSILIIDDNKDLLAFLLHSLKDSYRIILAENGKQGLQRLEKHAPDLIISDVMMPVMGGLEFSQQIKSNINTSHIPLIMLSAKSTTPEQIEGLSTGADIYITKPFSIEYLKLQISNILNLIKQRQKAVETGKPLDKSELKLTKRDQEFLDKLNKLIDNNIDNNSLTNDFLAEKLFVSNSTLYRKSTALTGKGINDYIRFKKLVKSTELIKSGEYSISEIAYMTGFNTPSYFSQCFKKEFGVLPKEFS